jgi:3-hydroxyisobutyrate dehydrogenase-like beta-hydroxyacid dehydrogenase
VTAVAVLGLGEAGQAYARGLAAAGAEVRGFDPHQRPEGIRHADGVAEAVEGADLVLSLVGGSAAAEVADGVMPWMPPAAVYADLNTASPAVKQHIAGVARGVLVADVAVLAPVHRDGHRTELLASGPGAVRAAQLLRPYDVPISVLDADVGEAARLKLLRSVFMKGLAALVIETTTAAQATGAESWLRGQIVGELGPDGPALIDRLLTGTPRHAARRVDEMRDALAELEASALPADMTRATLAWLERLRDAGA